MNSTQPPDDPLFSVTPRGARYFVAIIVVVAGIVCGATVPGGLGGTMCTVIVGVGLIALISMILADVGLIEDRGPVPPSGVKGWRGSARRRHRRLGADETGSGTGQ